MLKVKGLTCGYGDLDVVRNLSFEIAKGEIFALIGANGAGKTSTLMCLAGHVQRKTGTVTLADTDIAGLPVHDRVGKGLAIVPEGRRIFPDLTVDENLTVGGHCRTGTDLDEARKRVRTMFPRLAERADQLAGSLSGGEQQMLAIGRALMSGPQVLMVDELSLGLMPKMVDECYLALTALRDQGLTILLVEQNTEKAFSVADRVLVLESGEAGWTGTAKEAMSNSAIIDAYLGTH